MNEEMNRYVTEKHGIIPSFPDYGIDEYGVICRLTKARGTYIGKKIAIYLSQDGYPKVTLTNNGHPKSVYLHSLVCETYIGERPGKYQINHKDGDKMNNHISNLEYCTISDNVKHAFAIGLQKPRDQQGNKNSRWTGGRILTVCSECGEEVKRNKADIKRHRLHFCSLKCLWEYNRGKSIQSRINPVRRNKHGQSDLRC
jgi:hypothetical protein